MEPTTVKRTLCLVSGKSGGHIIPCLNIAQQWKEHNPNGIVTFFSTKNALDQQIISNNTLINIHIVLSFGTHTHYVRTIGSLLTALYTSFIFLYRHKPEKIISTGGAVAIPVCLSAWVLRIPIELYELNAVPGKAITFLRPFATRILVCFKQAQQYFPAHKCQYIQYPMRFTNADRMNQQQACELLGFSIHKKTIFIIGGSQGSQYLNTLVCDWLKQCSYANQLQIIHQTGLQDHALKVWYKTNQISAHVFAYDDNLARYYNAADLIMSRAGAGLLFESIFFKKQCLVIPLETKTTGHQYDNAQAMAHEYPELVTVIKQREKEKIFDYLTQYVSH
jgi:UDP-N-acetylglucosamine--N-acetylmuramyl-(pentapeptide) pyrophosphoryl-undecaprenol N-acetylglucosamine transferase